MAKSSHVFSHNHIGHRVGEDRIEAFVHEGQAGRVLFVLSEGMDGAVAAAIYESGSSKFKTEHAPASSLPLVRPALFLGKESVTWQ